MVSRVSLRRNSRSYSDERKPSEAFDTCCAASRNAAGLGRSRNPIAYSGIMRCTCWVFHLRERARTRIGMHRRRYGRLRAQADPERGAARAPAESAPALKPISGPVFGHGRKTGISTHWGANQGGHFWSGSGSCLHGAKNPTLHAMKHTLLLIALIATQAQAQIIYTDVIPDSTYNASSDTCSLDVDNDGDIDFLIVQRTLAAPCPGNRPECNPTITRPRSSVRVTPLGTNAVANVASFAAQLPAWQSIDPASAWNNAAAQVLMTQGVPLCIQGPPFQFACGPGSFTGEWLSGASVDSPRFLGSAVRYRWNHVLRLGPLEHSRQWHELHPDGLCLQQRAR